MTLTGTRVAGIVGRFGAYCVPGTARRARRARARAKARGAVVADRALIFLHVPKAGGSTLDAVIARHFRSDAVFRIDGDRVLESIDEFKRLPDDRRGRIMCLMGHMPFGLHRHLPRPAVYVTMLRHPVERIISHYNFVLRTPAHYLHERVVSKGMGLAEYVSSGVSPELSNSQTNHIAGIGGSAPDPGDMLDAARENLRDRFAVAGLTERFDESLLLIGRLMGWRNVFYVRRNVTRPGSPCGDVPPATVRLIEERNDLDMELHDFAKRLLAEKIAGLGPGFARDLAAFRRMNTVGGPATEVCMFLRHPRSALTGLAKRLFART